MDGVYCKKCLLRDMEEDEYFADLKGYIERIDDELKADNAEYERRLSICTSCDRLINGMCTVCGCYVELRAVMSKNYCPQAQPKW